MLVAAGNRAGVVANFFVQPGESFFEVGAHGSPIFARRRRGVNKW